MSLEAPIACAAPAFRTQETAMASGGSRVHSSRTTAPTPRSRTGLVIDQLLSRGPNPHPTAGGGRADATSGPWASVAPILRRTATAVLEGHLGWLVARAELHDPFSSERILLEDQVRILLRALEERGDDEAITRALERGTTARPSPENDQTASDVPGSGDPGCDDPDIDEDDVLRYASDLSTATGRHLEASPYVALAGSAAQLADEILDHRGAPAPARPDR
jgi:hypothetical protein